MRSAEIALVFARARENDALAIDDAGRPLWSQPLSFHDLQDIVGQLSEKDQKLDFAIAQHGDIHVKDGTVCHLADEEVRHQGLLARDHLPSRFRIAGKLRLRSEWHERVHELPKRRVDDDDIRLPLQGGLGIRVERRPIFARERGHSRERVEQREISRDLPVDVVRKVIGHLDEPGLQLPPLEVDRVCKQQSDEEHDRSHDHPRERHEMRSQRVILVHLLRHLGSSARRD